jgi:hypothetical protein
LLDKEWTLECRQEEEKSGLVIFYLKQNVFFIAHLGACHFVIAWRAIPSCARTFWQS